jgi:hypothetical protein
MNGNFVVDWTGLVDRDAEDGGGSPRRLMSPDAFALMIAPATPDLGTDFNSHWSDKPGSAGPLLLENMRQGGIAHSLCGEVVTDSAESPEGFPLGAYGWDGKHSRTPIKTHTPPPASRRLFSLPYPRAELQLHGACMCCCVCRIWPGIFTTKFTVHPAKGISFACFSQVHPCWEHNLNALLCPMILNDAFLGAAPDSAAKL